VFAWGGEKVKRIGMEWNCPDLTISRSQSKQFQKLRIHIVNSVADFVKGRAAERSIGHPELQLRTTPWNRSIL
jgi:hypothetical protein